MHKQNIIFELYVLKVIESHIDFNKMESNLHVGTMIYADK